jgi:hypothetical protein
MRRGEGVADWGIGGAWHCAVRTLAGESKTCDALKSGNTATKTGEKDRPGAEDGCIKGACMDGIVLQHSWLCSWPCDEQCIVSQQCIAASGVDMAKQSTVYVAKAITITGSKIVLIRRIIHQSRRVPNRSQERMVDAVARDRPNIRTSQRPGQVGIYAP